MPAPTETQDEINEREWNSTWNWSGGYYSSKLDTRLWVPKRGVAGSGSALNMGHPGAKVVLVGISLPLLGIVLMLVIWHFAR